METNEIEIKEVESKDIENKKEESKKVNILKQYEDLSPIDLVDTFERFADDSDMSKWARVSVYFMTEQDIIKGVGEKKFNPNL